MTALASHALRYALGRGWFVFPVEERGKRPLTPNGVKDATTNFSTISSWWGIWPAANIGLATGKSGLVVIDIDTDPQSAAAMMPSVPKTLTAETGSGGYHLFFKAPDWPLGPTVGRLPGVGVTPGVDLRAGDSYVILPPSIHPSGKAYEWADNFPIAPCPSWLRPAPPKPAPVVQIKSESKYAAAALQDVCQQVRNAPAGQRNHTLNAATHPLKRFIEAGQLDREMVEAAVMSAALDAGLQEQEIRLTVRSALR